ncbi:MAG: hypothetical protein HY222_04865 [Thaumarchaeota archaeon]|nr:hypothetical protein [Nitrososphaerota archaeon]MBI3641706.1 hypothetical protein [Nitrososphaerota archaeon]
MYKHQKYLLLPVLAVIISSLLFSAVASNVSATSALNVAVSVAKNTISRGSVESVAVKVTSNGKAISNADVSAVVVYASGFTKSFSGKTDSNGLWMFSWQIGGNSNPGTFGVYVKASKTGYDSGNNSASFIVTTASGKLKKY